MGKLDPSINALAERAGQRDLGERSDVFRQVVEVFLSGDAPEDGETRDALLELAGVLISQTHRDMRKEVAERLARMPSPPMDLVNRLCHDDAELVGSLLMRAPFSDAELIELIRQTWREHHMIIARRADLTLDVWLALARAATRSRPSAETLAGLRRDWKSKATATAGAVDGAAAANDAAETGPMRPLARPLTVEENAGDSGATDDRSPATPSATEAAESSGRVRLRHGFYEMDDRDRDPETRTGGEPAGRPDVSDRAVDQGPRSARRPAPPSSEPADPVPPSFKSGRGQSMRAEHAEDKWIEEVPGPAFGFRTDRSGRISGLSRKAELAFGNETSDLFGQDFLAVFAATEGNGDTDALIEAARRHLPLRNFTTTTRNGRRRLRWQIEGQALFSFPDGRFLGYRGRATAADDATRRILTTERDDDRLVDDVLDIARQISLATEPDSASADLASLHGKATDLYALARRLQARMGRDKPGDRHGL